MGRRRKYPLVEVRWLDAKTYNEEWEDKEAPEKAQFAERYTVGYLVHQDDERTLLSATFDPPTGVADTTAIPTGWVQEINLQRTYRKHVLTKGGETNGKDNSRIRGKRSKDSITPGSDDGARTQDSSIRSEESKSSSG